MGKQAGSEQGVNIPEGAESPRDPRLSLPGGLPRSDLCGVGGPVTPCRVPGSYAMTWDQNTHVLVRVKIKR